jgi:hypothetical protein
MHTIRIVALLLSMMAVVLLAGSASSQNNLTEIKPEDAARLISRDGKWVLKEVDFRQVDADCAGKIWMKFFPDHKLMDRTHLGLAKDTPTGRPIALRPRAGSTIRSLPRLGGLHHRYAA